MNVAAPAPNERSNRLPMLALLALVTALLYVAATGHVWEDYLITYRHSKNLVDGHGLVFNPGERVHGFTSPLNTLLPALFQAVVRSESFMPALNLFRAVSLAMFVAAAALWLRAMRDNPGTDRFSPVLFAVLFATEAKSVAFTMNGQEIGLMIFFITLGFLASFRGLDRAWLLAGLAWAGLFWTRPDACVYIAILGLVGLVFAPRERRPVIVGALKATAICAALYLPWLAIATSYYGSPVPHTITAKGVTASALDPGNPLFVLRKMLQIYPEAMGLLFQPIYAHLGGWPSRIVEPFGFLCGAVSSLYFLVPSQDRLGRMASLTFALGCLYMSYIGLTYTIAPWYQPTVTLFGTVVLSRAIQTLAGRVPGLTRPDLLARSAQALLVFVWVYLFVAMTVQIHIQQKEIEYGTRKEVGLWLKQHMKPGETVLLEPLGYIGFYCESHVDDWPGLVSPRVVAERRAGAASVYDVIVRLKPEWLVFRPSELEAASRVEGVWKNYAPVQMFDAVPRLDQYEWRPGEGYLLFDSRFCIMRRKPASILETPGGR